MNGLCFTARALLLASELVACAFEEPLSALPPARVCAALAPGLGRWCSGRAWAARVRLGRRVTPGRLNGEDVHEQRHENGAPAYQKK